MMTFTVPLAFGMPAAPEWVFIGILALVLLGPKKLPELARGIGKAMAELQKAKEDFHREITGLPPLPKIQIPEGREGVTPIATTESTAPVETQPTSPADAPEVSKTDEKIS